MAEAKAAAKRETRYEITITLANDNEPKDIFIGGCEEGDFLITRGKKVIVPRSVLQRLDDAVMGVSEVDPEDPTRTVTVDRRRFNYHIERSVAV